MVRSRLDMCRTARGKRQRKLEDFAHCCNCLARLQVFHANSQTLHCTDLLLHAAASKLAKQLYRPCRPRENRTGLRFSGGGRKQKPLACSWFSSARHFYKRAFILDPGDHEQSELAFASYASYLNCKPSDLMLHGRASQGCWRKQVCTASAANHGDVLCKQLPMRVSPTKRQHIAYVDSRPRPNPSCDEHRGQPRMTKLHTDRASHRITGVQCSPKKSHLSHPRMTVATEFSLISCEKKKNGIALVHSQADIRLASILLCPASSMANHQGKATACHY